MKYQLARSVPGGLLEYGGNVAVRNHKRKICETIWSALGIGYVPDFERRSASNFLLAGN